MKKILALVLAIIMMAAIAVPAFAAATTQQVVDANNASNTEDVKVTYGVTQSYIVVIPIDVNFEEAEDGTIASHTRDLTAKDVRIAGNEYLTVAIDSLNGWKMKDAAAKSSAVSYTVKVDAATDPLADNGVALSLDRPEGNQGVVGATKTVVLTFATAGTAQEGTYEDKLTFNVAINVNEELVPDDAA